MPNRHKSRARVHDDNKYDCDPLESKVLYHLTRMQYEYRELDGSKNNKVNPEYGKLGKPFIRKFAAAYNNNDGCSLNDLNGMRPNPRDISNCIFKQTESIPNPTCLSNIFWVWGQFIDHDITLTHNSDQRADIDVAESDPLSPAIPFSRSEAVPAECNPNNQATREQINSLTPFIDASNVYGSSSERNNYIREFCGGRLKVIAGNIPPNNDSTMDNAGPGYGPNFVCGDIRANEHFGLSAMHTLFVREHNHWAQKISKACPILCDEEIYQRAKIMVEAEIQAITFNEFLPLLIGCGAISDYMYNPNINPQISNEFATAAYRFGHSMIPSPIYDGLNLKDTFFSTHFICNEHISIGEILKQLSKGLAEKIDAQVIEDLRNFLFGEPGQGGSDLVSLNIQRGRDHGLALVNDMLEACKLPKISRWSDVTDNVSVQNKLAQLYKKPEDIDIWVYGLLKKPEETNESLLSPLFHEIIKDGFTRLRDGDRLWYENRLSESQIKYVNNTRLSDIIRRNICDIKIGDNVFVVKSCNPVIRCTCQNRCLKCNPIPCRCNCNCCSSDSSCSSSSESSCSTCSTCTSYPSSSSSNSITEYNYCKCNNRSKHKQEPKNKQGCKSKSNTDFKKRKPVYLRVHVEKCKCGKHK